MRGTYPILSLVQPRSHSEPIGARTVTRLLEIVKDAMQMWAGQSHATAFESNGVV